jgi:hypothetical protein
MTTSEEPSGTGLPKSLAIGTDLVLQNTRAPDLRAENAASSGLAARMANSPASLPDKILARAHLRAVRVHRFPRHIRRR